MITANINTSTWSLVRVQYPQKGLAQLVEQEP